MSEVPLYWQGMRTGRSSAACPCIVLLSPEMDEALAGHGSWMQGYLEKGISKLPWREDGPPNHDDDKVDSGQ